MISKCLEILSLTFESKIGYVREIEDCGTCHISLKFGGRMTTDTEIKDKGIQALIGALGPTDTERFLTLIDRQPSDYTKWRHLLFEEMTLEDINKEASKLWKETDTNKVVS